MDKGQAFELIEQAKVRLLTDAEVGELGQWAEREFKDTPVTFDDTALTPRGAQHVLIDFVVTFMKQTRRTEHFVANFKLVDAQVMPWVINCFEAPKS
jgi:hypothetical protein